MWFRRGYGGSDGCSDPAFGYGGFLTSTDGQGGSTTHSGVGRPGDFHYPIGKSFSSSARTARQSICRGGFAPCQGDGGVSGRAPVRSHAGRAAGAPTVLLACAFPSIPPRPAFPFCFTCREFSSTLNVRASYRLAGPGIVLFRIR